MMRRRQALSERATDRVPRPPLALLAELIPALRSEHQIVAEPTRLVQDGTTSRLGHEDRAGGVVLGLGLATECGVELAPEVIDVAIEQAVAGGEDLTRAHTRVGGPQDQRGDLLPEAAAVMRPGDPGKLVDFFAGEDDDVLAPASVLQPQPGERVLVGQAVFDGVAEHRAQSWHRRRVRIRPSARVDSREGTQGRLAMIAAEPADPLTIMCDRRLRTPPPALAAPVVVRPARREGRDRLLAPADRTFLFGEYLAFDPARLAHARGRVKPQRADLGLRDIALARGPRVIDLDDRAAALEPDAHAAPRDACQCSHCETR